VEKENDMKKPMLRLSVIQDNPTVGDVQGNVAMAIEHLNREENVDLLVFPECFVSGYPLGDLVLRPSFMSSIEVAIDELRRAVVEKNGPAVLIGAPMTGARLPYNAAYLIEPSGEMRIVRKRELPNNDVFDELRTFAMSDERPTPLSFRGFNLGVMICEDMWHGDVARGLADELADVLVVLNGSPYQGGKQQHRRNIATTRVTTTKLPLIYANLIGGQDELVFDGASFIMNVEGGYSEAAAFKSDVMRLNLTRDDDYRVRIHLEQSFKMNPYPTDTIATDYMAAVLGLRDYLLKTGFKNAFVGVSGGLDSALVLAMAADAIGGENIIGVMMPTEFTGQESLDLADDLMVRLGVIKESVPISPMFEAVCNGTQEVTQRTGQVLGKEPDFGITQENFQARLRGMVLMGLTNALGGIVLSTGNKSEMSVGYATLYGDMSGGFNPLKSVYKSRAFKMAEWRNTDEGFALSGGETKNPIPEGIITRPPTAELANGQTDQASLGDYDLLDMVLHAIIEEKASATTAARKLSANFDKDDIFKRTGGYQSLTYARKIARLVRNAQYKRDQACPGVKLNLTDFGLGWRYPIAGKYSL
jgi:NAD+ synthase